MSAREPGFRADIGNNGGARAAQYEVREPDYNNQHDYNYEVAEPADD